MIRFFFLRVFVSKRRKEILVVFISIICNKKNEIDQFVSTWNVYKERESEGERGRGIGRDVVREGESFR